MASASAPFRGLPRMAPSRTTTVSAPMTRAAGRPGGPPTGLFPGEGFYQVPGVPAVEGVLVDLRRLCGKFQSHLPQQLPPPGGLGR